MILKGKWIGGILAGITVLACIYMFVVSWPGHAPKPSSPLTMSRGSGLTPAMKSEVGPVFPELNESMTDEELLTLGRNAVTESPLLAVDWARSQADNILRRRALSAVTRAWGERDPCTAFDWVLDQADFEQQDDMESVLRGAVSQPWLALGLVRQLLKNEPSDPDASAPSLMVALSQAGAFQTALAFLQNGAPADCREEWTADLFKHWAETQPQTALQALATMTNNPAYESTFRALADGWSQNNPGSLADYGEDMPGGVERDYVLHEAFYQWSLQNPEAMMDWLSHRAPGSSFDSAAADLIRKTDSANYPPATAMAVVDQISDPTLRMQSFLNLLGTLQTSDPTAARQYAARVPWLDYQTRQALINGLKNISQQDPIRLK